MDTEATPTDIFVHIVQRLVHRFHKIVHHRHWIQIPGIILALLLITLVFIATVQQWRGNLIMFNISCKPSTHYHTYQKYTECGYLICSSAPLHCTGK